MDAPVSVTVRGIAAGGSGVADLPDGRVVFVPRTAPGDRASIRIEKSRPRWAEGTLCELVEPAPERREPLCSLYDRCGGCQLQHLPYPLQLSWKGRVVADALERIGRLAGIEVPEVVGSPLETGYRSRVSFTLRRLRGGRVAAGFHELGRPSRVVDVEDECVLPRPELVETWRTLRARWGEGARRLPGGGRLRLTLRAGRDGVSLVVEGGPTRWRAEELADAVPSLVSIWHLPVDAAGEPRLCWSAGPELEAPIFTQVNTEAASLLVEHVLELAGEGVVERGDLDALGADPPGPPAPRAVDAYCGDGAYALGLAARGWRVTGIEASGAACDAARERARALDPETVTVVQGSVEERLQQALPADLVIVNPPRSGLDTEVVRVLREHPTPRLFYVSCDPATLARDVSGLASTYEVASLRCFDLFPQTAHVESVLVLAARAG